MTTNANAAVLLEGGTPDPLNFRRARSLADPFDDGHVFTQAAGAFAITIAIAGALVVRQRFLYTAAGTLSFAYLRPPPKNGTAYSSSVVPPVANVAVVANTEGSVDILPAGESLLLITFTPSGNGAVTFHDVMFS